MKMSEFVSFTVEKKHKMFYISYKQYNTRKD